MHWQKNYLSSFKINFIFCLTFEFPYILSVIWKSGVFILECFVECKFAIYFNVIETLMQFVLNANALFIVVKNNYVKE